MPKALIIDDETNMRWVLSKALTAEGWQTLGAEEAVSGRALLDEELPDVCFLDIRMPGQDGLKFLQEITAEYPGLPIIMMTAHGTMSTAIEAMKRGAFDYLTKPFDIDEAVLVANKALEAMKLARENEELRGELKEQYDPGKIIGKDASMEVVFKTIGRVTESDVPVLITGESGTGKELVARAVHYHSSRAKGPFVVVNCAAIPANLLESELFGHEKGAFTGAVSRRIGRFEQASGGTLFLDEVGEIPVELQSKLLRALQAGTFERVGGERTLRSDARVIAATNRVLKDQIREGKFREDLFYRLNVVAIELPPLRGRKGDVPLLVQYFLDRFAEETGRRKTLSPEAVSLIERYSWPGNVRELENLLKRAVVLSSGPTILPEHLPITEVGGRVVERSEDRILEQILEPLVERYTEERPGDLYSAVLSELELPFLRMVMERCGGNQVKAAQVLGINRNTLRKRLKELGLRGE